MQTVKITGNGEADDQAVTRRLLTPVVGVRFLGATKLIQSSMFVATYYATFNRKITIYIIGGLGRSLKKEKDGAKK